MTNSVTYLAAMLAQSLRSFERDLPLIKGILSYPNFLHDAEEIIKNNIDIGEQFLLSTIDAGGWDKIAAAIVDDVMCSKLTVYGADKPIKSQSPSLDQVIIANLKSAIGVTHNG